MTRPIRGPNWSDDENEALVSVYFDRLRAQARGEAFKMTIAHRALMGRVNRSDTSIRAKNCNISAVIEGLGEIWFTDYAPLSGYQARLADVVHRHLLAAPDLIDDVRGEDLDTAGPLDVVAPPTLGNEPSSENVEKIMLTARRFGVASRDENNHRLRRAGVDRALSHERRRLITAGREELAGRVRAVSGEHGEGPGFDIASFEECGKDRLLKVKTTKGCAHIPFHISERDVGVSEDRGNAWCLFRIFDFNRAPRAFELRSPLTRHVSLMHMGFDAEFMATG